MNLSRLSLRNVVSRIRRLFLRHDFSSTEYWRDRYLAGGNSGAGSYNHLAEFKAATLNRFVADHSIQSVIEFGCGDGNQLRLANYLHYVGYDISIDAIKSCRQTFGTDSTKQFHVLSDHAQETAQMAISLDVIFHLVEDEIFDLYMKRLFEAAQRYVAIYSSNTDDNSTNTALHVKHRTFTTWVAARYPEWHLIGVVPNQYPYDGDYTKTSFADFYFYQKQ